MLGASPVTAPVASRPAAPTMGWTPKVWARRLLITLLKGAQLATPPIAPPTTPWTPATSIARLTAAS